LNKEISEKYQALCYHFGHQDVNIKGANHRFNQKIRRSSGNNQKYVIFENDADESGFTAKDKTPIDSEVHA
jgi:hypothetical protein